MAIWRRGRPRELSHHSAGGTQYKCGALQQLMAGLKIPEFHLARATTQSHGTGGRSWQAAYRRDLEGTQRQRHKQRSERCEAMIARSGGKLGARAVVAGAGIGGLAAAAAVAPFFDVVTVVDKDELPETGGHRKGVVQDQRNPHTL